MYKCMPMNDAWRGTVHHFIFPFFRVSCVLRTKDLSTRVQEHTHVDVIQTNQYH